jgi:hypothetical protein
MCSEPSTVIHGLALENLIYKHLYPKRYIPSISLNYAVGNRLKELKIVTDEVASFGFGAFPDVIDRSIEIILHRMLERAAMFAS